MSEKQLLQSVMNFQSFLTLAKQDLESKKSSLKDQRKLIQQRHSAVKNYLNCQLFMITKHQKRLERFDEEVKQRLKEMDEQNEESWTQFLADIGKMKTRCKHILDVTDRYCVLRPEELHIKNLENISNRISMSIEDVSSMSSSSVDETDCAKKEVVFMSPNTNPPNQITQNIVKSTLQSFGCHLAVIAKTYTRRKGSLARNLSFSLDDRASSLSV